MSETTTVRSHSKPTRPALQDMRAALFSAAAASLFAATLVGPAAAAPASASFGMSASVTATVESDGGCTNNPGPYINLSGEISLGGLQARLRFTNNERGTHEATEDVETTISLLSDEPIRFNKQPSRGGVGGNPHVWLLLHDGMGGALSDPLYLGRCVQGFGVVSADTILSALVAAEVEGGDCKNSGGPFITLEGELRLGGLNATLVFTNNAAFTHVHEEDVTLGATLIPEGESITIPKQPSRGGVGGNPHIYLQFLNGDGTPIGDEQYLGRCSRL